jgi:hypothetical protein
MIATNPASGPAPPLIHLEECEPDQHDDWAQMPYGEALALNGRMCEGTQYMAAELFTDEPVWVERSTSAAGEAADPPAVDLMAPLRASVERARQARLARRSPTA